MAGLLLIPQTGEAISKGCLEKLAFSFQIEA